MASTQSSFLPINEEALIHQPKKVLVTWTELKNFNQTEYSTHFYLSFGWFLWGHCYWKFQATKLCRHKIFSIGNYIYCENTSYDLPITMNTRAKLEKERVKAFGSKYLVKKRYKSIYPNNFSSSVRHKIYSSVFTLFFSSKKVPQRQILTWNSHNILIINYIWYLSKYKINTVPFKSEFQVFFSLILILYITSKSGCGLVFTKVINTYISNKWRETRANLKKQNKLYVFQVITIEVTIKIKSIGRRTNKYCKVNLNSPKMVQNYKQQ